MHIQTRNSCITQRHTFANVPVSSIQHLQVVQEITSSHFPGSFLIIYLLQYLKSKALSGLRVSILRQSFCSFFTHVQHAPVSSIQTSPSSLGDYLVTYIIYYLLYIIINNINNNIIINNYIIIVFRVKSQKHFLDYELAYYNKVFVPFSLLCLVRSSC